MTGDSMRDLAMTPSRVPFDVQAYARRSQEGPCFVCAIVAGQPGYEHHLVFEDDETIAFLNRYPTMLGYTLVAPKQHVELWEEDLSPDAYISLQSAVRRVARAIKAVLPVERVYSLSLGSEQGNAHVHWHVAPLPPGVPYSEQQFHACMTENGVLDRTSQQQADLATAIRRHLEADG
jgi:diadenosine tetraphosphate (Ap4A) HIT family hydrolase